MSDLRQRLRAAADAIADAIDAELEARGDRLLTYQQTAERLGRHVATVQRWAKDGRLPVRQAPGEEPRVREADLEDFIANLPLRRPREIQTGIDQRRNGRPLRTLLTASQQ